jgi:hypothetical protein
VAPAPRFEAPPMMQPPAPPPRIEAPPVVERREPPREPIAPVAPTPLPAFDAPVRQVEAAPAAPMSSRGTSANRFSNPFLQQDPSTRARRLARALVSDLVVYYPEKRERGLADGNLKELFAEEIRKSWEEYSEQVGHDMASTTPYFNEALNQILAEGRAIFG